jgi:anaerobic magnesium-protoporphyrin IX monomethyl ester cyclase
MPRRNQPSSRFSAFAAASHERGGALRASLIFIRDRRFFSPTSSKFLRRRGRAKYPQGKMHYVPGEPPLGIMCLSSIMKEAGHEVSMTDQCHPEYSDEGFADSLRRDCPDLVGVSFLSNMCYPDSNKLSRKSKAALPTAKVVCGGVFATINAREIVATEESVDIVAKG